MGLQLYLLRWNSTFAPLSLCVCTVKRSCQSRERGRRADRQMVSLTVSWGLPLHSPLHLSLPISALSVIHHTPTSAPSLSSSSGLAFTGTRSHLSMPVCYVGGMSSVRCNPIWLIRCCMCVGVKSDVSLAGSLFSPIPVSFLVAVCIGNASVCLFRGWQPLFWSLRGCWVNSPQLRYLAAIYSHSGQSLCWSQLLDQSCRCLICGHVCQSPLTAGLGLFQCLGVLIQGLWSMNCDCSWTQI